MKRTALWELADSCAGLYKHLYEKYAPLIGSATAQQVMNKNNEAWKSFLALKKLEDDGRLPEHVRAVNSRPMRTLEARISRL